jgi:hypothetical protein
MRDILDDYIESKVRIGEIGVAVVATGVITKLIDVAGLADQVTSAFEWFAIVAALLWLSYFAAGSIHDWYAERREKHYVTVKLDREDVA